MKKILILGASELQLPAIISAKKMGLYTICVDKNEGAIGKEFADEFYKISTNDKMAVLEIANSLKIDGIMTLASDQPMNTISYVGTKLNLNVISQEVAFRTTNKGIMRNKLSEHNVPIPFFAVFNNEDEFVSEVTKYTLPLIVKPTDSSGSRGVQLLKDFNNLAEKFKYSSHYSDNKEVIVEEYLEGREFSVESITEDGITKIIAITQKKTTGAPHFVEIGHMIPADITEDQKKEIENIVTSTIDALEIKNGPTHCEIILTEEGPRVVEIGARLGGDNITSHLVPLATGYNMVNATIHNAINEKNTEKILFERHSLISYISSDKAGIIKSINGIDDVKKSPLISEVVLLKGVGDPNGIISSSSERIGYFIISGNSRREILEEAQTLSELITLEIE